ncbi:39S ribosomal protein L3, mitochondrial [Thelohanellus kitauei]|uniref:Large ribosomal subunit protein uL3m n=1 Tax=Thelohanellus kitauei TaxID=669202 RepID=A0A0C2MP67_THEKT|nr:39S ribosomal protein L3, mitochondrial [Thelohanellus kitauei]
MLTLGSSKLNYIKSKITFSQIYRLNSSDAPRKTKKKWQQGTLFERILKIDKPVDVHEKSPLEVFYPKTMKQGDVYIPPDLRCGAIGLKLGLTHISLNEEGPEHVLCTMIHIKDCEILQHIKSLSVRNDFEKHTLIVGADIANEEGLKYLNSQQKAYFESLNKPPFMCYRGFTVHPNNILRPGTKILATHFTPGQLLKISSISKDKGFLGVMQRWGYAGQCASHGVSKYHRGIGSICNLKTRVAPRTKMPGHTGLESRFVNGVQVLRINTKYNVLYVKGPIPGEIGQYVFLRDWWKNPRKVEINFPTFIKSSDDLPEDLFAPNVHNPFEIFPHEL